MKYGLAEQDIKTIITVMQQYSEIKEALIFGSRAMGNYKKGSDIDLALKGPVSDETLSKVRYELAEETILPYFFDIIIYADITNSALKEHINEYGKFFYKV